MLRAGTLPRHLIDIRQYLVVVDPGDEISGEVRERKVYLRRYFPDNQSLFAKAHLTVASIYLPRYAEYFFVQNLIELFVHAPVTSLLLDGYGYWVNKEGVIYIRANGSDFLQVIQRLIKRAIIDARLNLTGCVYPSVPHITVVKALRLSELHMLWPRIDGRPYQNSVRASSVTVLRRELNFSCTNIATIPFGDIPAPELFAAKMWQARLFS